MYNETTVYRDFLAEWVKTKRYDINAQSMRSTESYIRNQINPLIGELTLSEHTPFVLQNFVNTLKDRGLANASVKRIFSTVHSSLDMAEKMQIISKNHAAVVTLPRTKRKELQLWDIEQVQQFLQLAAYDAYTYVAFHLALLTGMRQGEILGLRWRDVDFDNELIFVRQTLSHDGKEFLPGAKSSSGIRSIALDAETVNILRKHHQRVQDDKEMY